MRVLLALLLTTLTAVPVWASDIALGAPVSAAVLYPQGATLTRTVGFAIPQGRHRLIVTDLPADIDAATLRVAVEGARLGALSFRNDAVPPRDAVDPVAVQAAEAAIKTAEAALRGAETDKARALAAREGAEARLAFLAALGQSDATAQPPEALRQILMMVGEETAAARAAILDAEAAATTLDPAITAAQLTLERAKAALAALVPDTTDRAWLAIEVDADAAGDARLTITHPTWNAAWQPAYDLRLTRATGALDIGRAAFLRQDTGEAWTDVAITLSTVRPSEQTAPSEVWPLPLQIVDPEAPQPMMRGEMSDNMAAESMAVAASAPKQAIADYDGLAVSYAYPDPVSLVSGPEALRLSLGDLTATATVRAEAAPLFDATAFLVAEFINDTGEILLPGSEVQLYRDGVHAGRFQMPLVAVRETARVPFGPIEGLRLSRNVLDRSEGGRGVITKSTERNEAVQITVRNLTAEPWDLRLTDRVPFSEQDALKIEVKTTPAPTARDIDGKRGVLRWDLTIPAGETREIGIDTRITWPEGKFIR
jgi:uncharacterized protein (TIGR02231 family)